MPTSFEEFQAAVAAKQAGLTHERGTPWLKPLPGEQSTVPGGMETLQAEVGGGIKQMMQSPASPGLMNMPMDTTADASEYVNVNPPNALMGAARVANAVPMAVGAMAGKPAVDAGYPGVGAALNVMGQVGTAVGGTGLARAGFRAAAPYLSGASDALLAGGLQDTEAMSSGLLEGRIPSKQLYGVVDQMNPQVASLPNLKRVAGDLKTNEDAMSKYGVESRAIINTADTIEDTLKTGGGIPFQEARSVLRRLGQRIDDLRDPMRTSTGSTEELGAMKQLYAGLLKDLETRTPKGATALKAANSAAKREFAVGELNDVIGKGVRAVQGKGPESINFGTMLNNLKNEVRKNELFSDAFDPGELAKIQDTLGELAKLPVATSPRGANFGSGLNAQRASLGGLAGAGIAKYVGGDVSTGAMLGGASSIVASKAISSLLSTEFGRGFLLKVVRNQPNALLTPQGISLLSAASRAASQQLPSE